MEPKTVVMWCADATTVERGGGIRTRYLVRPDLGAAEFLSGISEFDVGSFLRLHSHNCEESVVILAGQATFEYDGNRLDLEVGDTAWVPSGVPHRFCNRGDTPLRILWTYGRSDATRTFIDTGETVAVSSEGR